MKLNQVFVLFFVVFVIFDDTDSLFFGRRTRRKQQPKRVNPNNNKCYYDNQCSTGKCRRFDNIFCGIGSKYIREFFCFNYLGMYFLGEIFYTSILKQILIGHRYFYSLQVNIKLEINFCLLLRNHALQNSIIDCSHCMS